MQYLTTLGRIFRAWAWDRRALVSLKEVPLRHAWYSLLLVCISFSVVSLLLYLGLVAIGVPFLSGVGWTVVLLRGAGVITVLLLALFLIFGFSRMLGGRGSLTQWFRMGGSLVFPLVAFSWLSVLPFIGSFFMLVAALYLSVLWMIGSARLHGHSLFSAFLAMFLSWLVIMAITLVILLVFVIGAMWYGLSRFW